MSDEDLKLMEIARGLIEAKCDGNSEEREYYTVNFFKYLSDREISINSTSEQLQSCFIDFALGTLPNGNPVKYKNFFDIMIERANRRAEKKNRERLNQRLVRRS